MKGYILRKSPTAVQIVRGNFIDHVMGKFMKEVIPATSPSAVSIITRNFIFSSNLKFHERTLTGEKQFSCSNCEKKFS